LAATAQNLKVLILWHVTALLKTENGNGKTENGKRKTENGKRRTKNGNGKRKTETENEKRKQKIEHVSSSRDTMSCVF